MMSIERLGKLSSTNLAARNRSRRNKEHSIQRTACLSSFSTTYTFVRLGEERIGIAADYRIVSYISNSSYLTGRSHPLMRESLLTNFHKVWIDNLNGDKYRTGKLIPQGLPGAGTADQSIFTTEMDPHGIQPGTAIATWLKRQQPKSAPGKTEVLYRDFWGLAATKRAALIASLPTGTAAKGTTVPSYAQVRPSRENRWRLSPHTQEAGYESWPGLDEVFPISFQGVNHNRGLEGGMIDSRYEVLQKRLHAYFNAETFEDAKRISPEIATERARYDPEAVWRKLKAEGHFNEAAIKPFLVFPLDQRFIYYVDKHKWLNEARPEFAKNLDQNEFLVSVPEPRKVSETLPIFSTTLVNLHVHERGSVVFPRQTRGADLFADQEANIDEAAWRTLREIFGLHGDRRDEHARVFVGKMFRVAFAVLHAPSYEAEHASALSADWAHLPIPKESAVFGCLTDRGEQVARLLDANRDARDVIDAILGHKRAATIGALRRRDGGPVTTDDLKVTVTYWGGGKGRWVPRAFLEEEKPENGYAMAWGHRTGELFINDTNLLCECTAGRVDVPTWRLSSA